MKHSILYWARFGAVATATAAITATLLNMGSAFAADTSADLLHVDPGLVKKPGYESLTTADIVDKPSIHDKVMDELTRGEPVDSYVRIKNRDTLRGTNEGSAASNVPTSMLWPAYKYIPHLSRAVTG